MGAVFSPITAEMEPIEIGNKNENLYDCYTLSCVEEDRSSSGGRTDQIKRTVNWVTLNPYGEALLNHEDVSSTSETVVGGGVKNYCLPKFESFNFAVSDLLEEDVMGNEPGLVFFEVWFFVLILVVFQAYILLSYFAALELVAKLVQKNQ